MNGTLEKDDDGYNKPDGVDAEESLQGMRKLRGDTDKARYGAQASGNRQSGMDPAEIVNMALNLSESRRRHLSAGRLASMPISSGRRVASAGLQQPNLALQGSYRANESGNLLQQHLQRHINSSRAVSPASGRPNSYVSHGSNTPTPLDRGSEPSAGFDQPIGYGFHFSTGTIARAEKARKAIEMSIEFRRLLQFLPPLQPDPFRPDGDRLLGRAYNPLQLIRNRKVRARERKQLGLDADVWDDVDTARCWVDDVEEQSARPEYRQQDVVMLPSPRPEMRNKATGKQQSGPSAKTKRTRMDWTISPCEAFADAHWLEQDDNKSRIEDRHGHKLFPIFRSSSINNVSMDAESIHHETRHKYKGDDEAVSASSSIFQPDVGEDTRGRAHKRRNFLHLPITDGHGKFKRRSWHRSTSRSSTSSNLSNSEGEEGGGQTKPTIKVSVKDQETGPLARHIDALMQSENAGRREFPPVSPDYWDNNQAKRPISDRLDNNLDSSTTGDSLSPRDHRHWPTSKFLEFHKRPKHDLREETERQPRSSLDTLDSTAPNSPSVNHFVPGISMDLSPPSTGADASPNKHKLPKFTFFRHGDDKAKHHIESNDFAISSHERNVSRLAMDDARVSNRSSLEVPRPTRPTRLRHVRSHTTDESSSLRDSKDRMSVKSWSENKEPSSAVGRFFKGGRIGDLVRSEGSRLSDRVRKRDSLNEDSKALEDSVGPSDASPYTSDDENEIPGRESKPRPFPAYAESTATDDEDRIGRQGSKPQYYMANLPSFKHSSTHEKKDPADSSAGQVDDPIPSQQRALRERSRSQRFRQLAPPKIDFTNISRASSPGAPRPEMSAHETYKSRPYDRRSSFGSSASRSRSPANNQGLSESLGSPGKLSGTIAPTGLSRVPVAGPEGSRSPDRSRPQVGHRHWSITDKPQEPQMTVDRREIARMEALLLSSGIKAQEITRRALAVRSERPGFLVKAAAIANAPLYPVARKEEHVLAARILSTHLEKTTKEIEGGVQRFRESDVQNLRAELHDVRMKIADELTPLVLNKADEGDAFIAELTSRHTLDIKQLNDYIELMKRQRWRRLRWVRRAGFTLLEWMLLGFMWWVWLIVVVIKSIKTIIMAVVNAIRWILWL